MEKLDITKDNSVQKELSGDFVYCEVQNEFTLPDYLPEIRKMIRIDAKVIPSGSFIGNARAEFAGCVEYNVIYSDNEGKLRSTALSSDYEFSVPVPAEHGELCIACDSTAENTQCRLSGPRRLTLRTSVKSRLHVYSTAAVEEIFDKDELALHTLSCKVETSVTRCASSGEFIISESLSLDGFSADALEMNYTCAELAVREARIGPEGVVCRGEVILKCNFTSGGASPFTLSKKLPFEQLVSIPKLAANGCIAHGRCIFVKCTLSPSGEGCSLDAEIGAQIDVECVENKELSLTKDAYSSECGSTPSYKTEYFSRSLGCVMSNYTVGTRYECEDEDALVTVLDTTGRAEVKNITEKDGRAVVVGECKINVLLSRAVQDSELAEYENKEVIFPFKLETELRVSDGTDIDYDCHVEAPMTRARVEKDGIYADAEIFLALRASKKTPYRLLEGIALDYEDKKCASRGKIVVYYPQDGDTLFSVAKKYRVDYFTLAEQNGIPEDLAHSPNEPISLDGISHIIIA